jgi:hypothetical protein
MPRRLPEELAGRKLVPVAVAANLPDAKKIEAVFDRAGLDYTFEISPVAGRSILSIVFGSVKKGVVFLVAVENKQLALELLEREGLSELIMEVEE